MFHKNVDQVLKSITKIQEQLEEIVVTEDGFIKEAEEKLNAAKTEKARAEKIAANFAKLVG